MLYELTAATPHTHLVLPLTGGRCGVLLHTSLWLELVRSLLYPARPQRRQQQPRRETLLLLITRCAFSVSHIIIITTNAKRGYLLLFMCNPRQQH